MKIIDAIKFLKTGAPLRDFNISPRLNALRTVSGIQHTYKVINGKTCIEYTYQKPMITSVQALETEEIPVVVPALPEETAIGIPCDLYLPQRERFTQGNQYTKIADVFNNDGERFYVLIHKVLGGKLYRKPEYVRLQDSGMQEAA